MSYKQTLLKADYFYYKKDYKNALAAYKQALNYSVERNCITKKLVKENIKDIENILKSNK